MSSLPRTIVPENYVPAPTGLFRVVSTRTKAFLFTNSTLQREIHAIEGKGEDQWFSAEVAETGRDQLYIRSNTTSQFIALEDSPGNEKIYTYPTRAERSKLLLLRGSDARADQFRIFCPSSKMYVIASPEAPQGVLKALGGGGDYVWWEFVYRDPVLVGIQYNESGGQIDESTQLLLNTQKFSGSGGPIQVQFVTKQSVEHSSLWELSKGYPEDVNGVFAVPGVSGGRVVVGPPRQLRFKFNESLRYSKEWNETFTLALPPGFDADAAASITRSRITVPFTAKFRSSDQEIDVSGTYQGITTHNYKLKTEYNGVKEKDLFEV